MFLVFLELTRALLVQPVPCVWAGAYSSVLLEKSSVYKLYLL